MSDKEKATAAVEALIEAKEDLAQCMQLIEKEMPKTYARITQLQADIPRLRSKVQDELRSLGPGQYTFDAAHIEVRRGRKKTSVDVEGLLELAEDRDEIEMLEERGVLEYSVRAHQIQRLPPDVRNLYEAFVDESSGSPAVYMPSELK